MQIYVKICEYIIFVLRMLLRKQVGYRTGKWADVLDLAEKTSPGR